MSKRKPPTSIHLSEGDESDFESAMGKEGMDKLGPWIKRAARLHADRVLHGKGDDIAELRDEVKQLKDMLQDLMIRLGNR